jgi:hypothetical protein
MDTCIYCKQPNTEPSAEHVVADALGGCILLPPRDCCKRCNGVFDQHIDRAVQGDLKPILAQLAVPGKRGTTTRWTATEIVDGDERRFNVTATEIVAAEPRKLLGRTGNVYRFRTTSQEELERARLDIEARNPGHAVQITEVIEHTPELPDHRLDDVDFSASHWARWAAKTCLNVICYALGRDVALRSEFDDLRDLAPGRSAVVPTDLLYGGLGGAVAEINETPAEHRISARAGSAGVQVCVILFGFCGVTFARPMTGLPALERVVVMDAVAKRVIADVRR